MAESNVQITAGSGTNVGAWLVGSNYRQSVVLTDPTTAAGAAPVDATNGLAVQVIPALPAGTNAIGKLAANSGVIIGDVNVVNTPAVKGAKSNNNAAPGSDNLGVIGMIANAAQQTWTEGNITFISADLHGNQRIRIQDAAGNDRGVNVNANNAALVAFDQTTLGSTNGVTPVPSAANAGWTFFYQAGGLSSTKQQIKATAGTFGGWAWLMNPNTATTYIQVFNKASASVTVGTTTPDFVIVLPGIATASATGMAANMEMLMGIAMSTGITVAATTTETGSTAPANPVWVTFLYK